jgi:hypothetical protein
MLGANVAAMLMLSDTTSLAARGDGGRGTHRAAALAGAYSAASVSAAGAQSSPD